MKPSNLFPETCLSGATTEQLMEALMKHCKASARQNDELRKEGILPPLEEKNTDKKTSTKKKKSSVYVSSVALPADWFIGQEWVVRDAKGNIRGVSPHRLTAEYTAFKSFALPPNPNKV